MLPDCQDPANESDRGLVTEAVEGGEASMLLEAAEGGWLLKGVSDRDIQGMPGGESDSDTDRVISLDDSDAGRSKLLREAVSLEYDCSFDGFYSSTPVAMEGAFSDTESPFDTTARLLKSAYEIQRTYKIQTPVLTSKSPAIDKSSKSVEDLIACLPPPYNELFKSSDAQDESISIVASLQDSQPIAMASAANNLALVVPGTYPLGYVEVDRTDTHTNTSDAPMQSDS